MDIVVQQNSMVHYFNRLTIEFYYVIMMLKHYIDNICIQYIHYNCYKTLIDILATVVQWWIYHDASIL